MCCGSPRYVWVPDQKNPGQWVLLTPFRKRTDFTIVEGLGGFDVMRKGAVIKTRPTLRKAQLSVSSVGRPIV